MARAPRVTATELLRALHLDGWYDQRQKGGHLHLKHPTKPGRVTLPVHPGPVPPGTLASILDQASLTAVEWRHLP